MQKHIISHFQLTDEILAGVIPYIEPFSIEKSDALFYSLVESIISQQLSVKAGIP
jgi:3-methyladenine DNA glycosylase/8-oxoguanine DNA glycosylase